MNMIKPQTIRCNICGKYVAAAAIGDTAHKEKLQNGVEAIVHDKCLGRLQLEAFIEFADDYNKSLGVPLEYLGLERTLGESYEIRKKEETKKQKEKQ